jgi:hypothetical protein
MFDPTPELPNDTLIIVVRFPTILRNALMSAGFKTGPFFGLTGGGRLGLARLRFYLRRGAFHITIK